jgi:hypothetical protein
MQATTPVTKIQHVMYVTTLSDYVEKMWQFSEAHNPHIHLIDNKTRGCIMYAMKKEHSNSLDVDQMTKLAQDFQHFTQQYELQMTNITNQLTSAKHDIIGYEHFAKNYFTEYKMKIEKMTKDVTTHAIADMHKAMDDTLTRASEEFLSKTATFEHELNRMIDTMLQDVYCAVEEAQKAMNETRDDTMKTLQKCIDEHFNDHVQSLSQTAPTPTPISSHFPYVCLESTFRRSPNPYESLASVPDTSKYVPKPVGRPYGEHHATADGTTYFPATTSLPKLVRVDTMHTPLIPPVDHDQVIKRAKFQFTRLGDIFVFYNQLMNGMEQFGIYLIPLNSIA